MKIIELINMLEKAVENGVDENLEVITTVFWDDMAYSAFIDDGTVESLGDMESFTEGLTPKQQKSKNVFEIY